jgi:hypothetical protein
VRGNKDPRWLQPLWEKKKADTARRVERAVKELIRLKEPVTLEGIRKAVKSRFGVPSLRIRSNATRRRMRPTRSTGRQGEGRRSAIMASPAWCGVSLGHAQPISERG